MDPLTELPASWQVATATATALITAHDRIPRHQDDRLNSFATWRIDQATGEDAVHALLSMALHLTAVDADAVGPQEARHAIESVTLSATASLLQDRPAQDLLAGIPASCSTPGAALIRLLIHSTESRAVLALERLSLATRRLLLTLAHEQPPNVQIIRDVLKP
ncbi:hypothetical protein [Streptomyces sp. NPDC056544]|uniref:hypothetical protein n=1 Tax=unclassified Streptomyces TaxID=2593676 RepID=UPI0036810164